MRKFADGENRSALSRLFGQVSTPGAQLFENWYVSAVSFQYHFLQHFVFGYSKCFNLSKLSLIAPSHHYVAPISDLSKIFIFQILLKINWIFSNWKVCPFYLVGKWWNKILIASNNRGQSYQNSSWTPGVLWFLDNSNILYIWRQIWKIPLVEKV